MNQLSPAAPIIAPTSAIDAPTMPSSPNPNPALACSTNGMPIMKATAAQTHHRIFLRPISTSHQDKTPRHWVHHDVVKSENSRRWDLNPRPQLYESRALP